MEQNIHFIKFLLSRNFLLLSMDFPIRSYLQGNSSNWNRFGLLKKIHDALKIKNNTFNCIWQWTLCSEHITSFCIFFPTVFLQFQCELIFKIFLDTKPRNTLNISRERGLEWFVTQASKTKYSIIAGIAWDVNLN